MDVRRLSLALLIALALSAGATYLLYAHLRSQKAATPTMIHVIAASSQLQAGTAIAQSNIRVLDWPASAPLVNAFSKPDQVVGRTLLYPVSPNEPLLETDLAAAGSGLGLSAKIPEGMRAISVRSNDVIGVAGFLYPGSHVDVILTYRPDTSPAQLTETILQDVTVLTAGQTLEPDPKGTPQTVNVVTLLLSPRDAQKMELATQQGTLQFVLRNGADEDHSTTQPVLVSQLANDIPPPVKPHLTAVARPKPAAPRAPDFYTVETIAGDRHTVEKF